MPTMRQYLQCRTVESIVHGKEGAMRIASKTYVGFFEITLPLSPGVHCSFWLGIPFKVP